MKIYRTYFNNGQGTLVEAFFADRTKAVKHMSDISGYDVPPDAILPWCIDEGPYYATLTEVHVIE